MAKKREKRSGAEEAAMDMTPMIDCVFQLIIFFVLTVNMEQESYIETLKLPWAPHAVTQVKRAPSQVTIQVSQDGTLYLGTKKSISLGVLKKVLADRVRVQGNDIPILIRGDGRTQHKHIRKAMDACAEVGLYRIRIAGLQQQGAK